jgi:RecB family exonuclease
MKFTPYSFSKINSFEMCPAKFDFNYIQKLRFWVPNLATERGSYIHTLLENDTKSKPTSFKFTLIDEEIERECKEIYKKFKESNWGKFYFSEAFTAEAEVEFGMKKTDEGLKPCRYYDKEALFRGKIDHFIKDYDTIYVADWKTGKISAYPAPLQLVMYAVWAFNEYPDVETVRAAFVYVEHPESEDMVKEYVFKREHLSQLTKKVIEKIVTIEKSGEFPKKEGPLCEYCDFRKKGICLETTSDEFTNDMMKYAYKKKPKKELHYFIHPESGSAWIQDYIDDGDLDGLVEEIDETMFYELIDFGYDPKDIDKTIHTREEK